MDDFRLKVFYVVSMRQSFTKAALELCISQPAVTKHVKLLEDDLGIQLFERKGSFITHTEGGEILHKYAARIFDLYQEAKFELSALKKEHQGSLHVGASTTIAHYFISPILASFYEKFPNVKLSLLKGNTQQIENALLSNTIRIGLVEGKKHMAGIRYSDFTLDELVPVVHNKSKYAKKDNIELDELLQLPLVMRERGSGTLEVVESALKEHGVALSSLNVIMHLGSTESIKSFLEHSHAFAFFSLKAIEKEINRGEFIVLKIKAFSIQRKFSFIQIQGKQDNLSTLFVHFAKRHYNQK